jgi:hypothetical protein
LVPVVAVAGLTGGVIAATSGDGDCGKPYNRQAFFGSVPTPSARKAAITAATVDGVATDFYTGLPLDPKRIDIDHVVPLAETWPVTCAWTRAERRSMGNDGLNLRPTDLSINRSKSDLTPSEWSPVDRARSCVYGTLYLRVVAKWKLPVTEDDAAAVQSACGDAIG